MARRRGRRSSSRGLMGGGMNKWLKIAAFSTGAVVLGASVLPNVDPKIKAAAAGFFAGGPIGAAAGYIAGPIIASKIAGASGATGQTGSYTW